jgi:hypothetical protein
MNNIPLYSDVAFSIILIFGSMIAWEDRRLFVLTSSVSIDSLNPQSCFFVRRHIFW